MPSSPRRLTHGTAKRTGPANNGTEPAAGAPFGAEARARTKETKMDSEAIAILTDTNSGITPEQAAEYGVHLMAMPVLLDAGAGAAWQAELQRAFPELTVGLDPLPISISCHTGDGALGAGMMKDILCGEGREKSR